MTACGSKQGKIQKAGSAADSSKNELGQENSEPLPRADSLLQLADNQEATYTEDAELKGFKTLSNERFQFKIDIPEAWKAVDISKNSDGFHLIVDSESGADIRVFGQEIDPNLLDIYTADCFEVKPFEFSNGLGSRCIGKDEVSYFRDRENVRINMYIKDWSSLSQKEQINSASVARSLRFWIEANASDSLIP